MESLHVLVFLLGLFVLCHSECYFQELVIKDSENPPKGCVDLDGQLHDFDSDWVRDCMDCSCTKEGMSCCSKIPHLWDIPEECELVLEKETCSSKVVQKSDKSKACNIL